MRNSTFDDLLVILRCSIGKYGSVIYCGFAKNFANKITASSLDHWCSLNKAPQLPVTKYKLQVTGYSAPYNTLVGLPLTFNFPQHAIDAGSLYDTSRPGRVSANHIHTITPIKT